MGKKSSDRNTLPGPVLDGNGDLGVPCRLAHYRVLRKLGVGGMGGVYLADEPALGRQVALKILKPALARDTNYVRRFQQEAQAVARFTHPHIVGVHFIGRTGKIVFFAMEYVEGETLSDRLRRDGKFAVSDALTFGRQVAEGLAYAHEMGIIHRDIKPANLFLTPKGALKIGDFGLAKKQDDDLSLTQTGSVLGSPHYMSPEQSTARTVDHRSDIYSLGATLYHLVSGKPPYEGDSPVEVFTRHMQDEIEPIEHLPPQTRERFHSLISRMMAKSPDDRFQSCREVVAAVDELAAFVETAPTMVFDADEAPAVTQIDESFVERPEVVGLGKPSRRGGKIVIAAVVVVVVLIIADAQKKRRDAVNSYPSVTSTPTPAAVRTESVETPTVEQVVPTGFPSTEPVNVSGRAQERMDALSAELIEATRPSLVVYDFADAEKQAVLLLEKTDDEMLRRSLKTTVSLLSRLVAMKTAMIEAINKRGESSPVAVKTDSAPRALVVAATKGGFFYRLPGAIGPARKTMSWDALSPQAYFDLAENALPASPETDTSLFAFAWVYLLNDEILPLAKRFSARGDTQTPIGSILAQRIFQDRKAGANRPGTKARPTNERPGQRGFFKGLRTPKPGAGKNR